MKQKKMLAKNPFTLYENAPYQGGRCETTFYNC